MWNCSEKCQEIPKYFHETIEISKRIIKHILSEQFHITQYYFFPVECRSWKTLSYTLRYTCFHSIRNMRSKFKGHWCEVSISSSFFEHLWSVHLPFPLPWTKRQNVRTLGCKTPWRKFKVASKEKLCQSKSLPWRVLEFEELGKIFSSFFTFWSK